MDESQKEKDAVLFTRPWELFGFGCHYAWIVFLVIDPLTLLAPVTESNSLGPSWAPRVILMLGIALAYGGIFLYCRKVVRFSPSKTLLIAGGCLGMAGTLLLLFFSRGFLAPAVWVAAALCIGFSYAFSMTAGNLFWSRNRQEMSVMQLTVSSAVAAGVYGLLLCLPAAASLLLASLLPLVGDIILVLSKGGKRRPRALMERPLHSQDRVRLLAYAFLYMLGYGAVIGAALPTMTSLADQRVLASLPILLGLVTALGVSLVLSLRKNPLAWMSWIDRLSGAIMVVGAAGVACFAGSPACAVMLGLFLCGGVFADHFVWILNADLAYRDRKEWAQAIAAGVGLFQWAGISAGSLVVLTLISGGNEGLIGPAVFGAFCFYVLGRFFVLSREDAMRLWMGRESHEAQDLQALRVATVAKKFAFSPRETDVVELLAQGRSVTAIQEQLTLSQSTVKTHIRSIYRKAGVGNKQEFISLLMATEIPGETD